MNTITIVGHVGNDPKFDSFPSGKNRVQFSLPIRDFANNTEGKAHWLLCEGWDKVAERAKYITKGREVVITGRLSFHSWDKEVDGEQQKQRRPVVIIGSFQLCGKRSTEDKNPGEDEEVASLPEKKRSKKTA
jgi:single stranded DNA-binding protein